MSSGDSPACTQPSWCAGCGDWLLCPAEPRIDGVHLVLGTEQKGHIAEYVLDYLERMPEERCVLPLLSEVVRTADIRTFVPSCSCGDRTRYFLKVQDGCDYYCTYCTIPKARGRSRNGSIASLVEQARGVAARGGHEIVITGVNIGDFGKSTGERFIDLLGALDAVEGIDRYRISSIEPDLLTDDVITFCARSRAFMPHFHIPLQCGSDEVLRLMHRHYDTALFEEKITRIRSLMPDAFIGVDVIVGSRGETEGLFRQSLSFMQRIPVSQYHVFSYSERPGTMALKIPHVVRTEEKHARSQKVIALSERLLTSFYERFVGQVRPVLIEHSRKAGCVHGFTDNYIRVEIPCGQTMPDNVILPVRLGNWNATHDALMGTVVQCGCKHGDDE